MSTVDKINLDMGKGYFSYSGRPQTVPFLCDNLQSLNPIDGILNLVLHSNFDSLYVFLAYFLLCANSRMNRLLQFANICNLMDKLVGCLIHPVDGVGTRGCPVRQRNFRRRARSSSSTCI